MVHARRFLVVPVLLAVAVAAATLLPTCSDPHDSAEVIEKSPARATLSADETEVSADETGQRPGRARRSRAAVTNRRSIDGRVVGPGGRPLAGLRVETHATEWTEEGGGWVFFGGTRDGGSCRWEEPVVAQPPDPPPTWTDDDGVFVIDDVHRDIHKVRLHVPERDSLAAAPVRVDVSDSASWEEVTIRAYPVGTLEVEVLGADGRPVEAAVVESEDERQTRWNCRREVDNSFRERVPAGRHVVSVTSHFGSAEPIAVEVPRGETARATFRLDEGTCVAGTVVDSNGAPVWGVVVSAFRNDESAGPGRAAATRADGTFRVTGLRPGQHRLVVHGTWIRPTAVGNCEAPAEGHRIVAPGRPSQVHER